MQEKNGGEGRKTGAFSINDIKSYKVCCNQAIFSASWQGWVPTADILWARGSTSSILGHASIIEAHLSSVIELLLCRLAGIKIGT